MITKIHYKRVAHIISEYRLQTKTSREYEIVWGIHLNLARIFQKDNPKFNERKFEEACGFVTDRWYKERE